MIVTPCTSVRMEDKHSIMPMIELQEQLFGASTLESFGTDKGYYSNANQKYLTVEKSISLVHLQKPGMDLKSLPETDQVEKLAMTNRRSGIEPLIGHIKRKGQLRKSRMKTDQSTLASGYAAVGGFNLRQITRHQLGKEIKQM